MFGRCEEIGAWKNNSPPTWLRIAFGLFQVKTVRTEQHLLRYGSVTPFFEFHFGFNNNLDKYVVL